MLSTTRFNFTIHHTILRQGDWRSSIHKDIKIPLLKETLRNTYLRHLTFHPNSLIRQISQNMLTDRQHRRLKRKRTTDILRENVPQIY